MGAISYIALREFEPTGYVKSGTDISADAADDSFNATSTVLTGLLDNEWIQVSGFANAVNNGWFQANGNSTSTKISQDTNTSLVTEAAGPAVTITGYRRGLNQTYDLEFYSERVNRSVNVKRSVQQPMGGGAPEVLLYRRETFIDVTVLGPIGALLTEVQILQWREFLASVEGGEAFTFDRYGTIAVPIEPKSAILETPDYSEERIAGAGNAGLYKLSIKVRLLT
jgi:hypothetical protein